MGRRLSLPRIVFLLPSTCSTFVLSSCNLSGVMRQFLRVSEGMFSFAYDTGSDGCNAGKRMNETPTVALITGAGNGIGRALAKLLAQEGYAIAAIDLRP